MHIMHVHNKNFTYSGETTYCMLRSRGGDQGSGPPPPPPLTKLTKPAFNVRPSSFKWHFPGGWMIARFWWYLDLVGIVPQPEKLSGYAHVIILCGNTVFP